MGYPFALVLHTHLPMVVNHGRWPHGSDWLNEAAFECYLPLLDVAHRLVADGISPKWTINLSPVLVEQLASPEFQKELAFYYDNVRRACVESRDYFAKNGAPEFLGLCDFWQHHYEWTPPTGRERGVERRLRAGIEELLAAHGLEYFVADSHLVAAGAPVFLYRDYIPARKEMAEPTPAIPVNEARSPYAPYRVASRG